MVYSVRKNTNKHKVFVARLKDNALVEYFKKRPGRKAKGIVTDQEIALKGIKDKLRLVQFNAEDGNEYRFITNAYHLKANVVAELYKERWQIELFFKWIKQNLKVKTFLGTSENASSGSQCASTGDYVKKIFTYIHPWR